MVERLESSSRRSYRSCIDKIKRYRRHLGDAAFH